MRERDAAASPSRGVVNPLWTYAARSVDESADGPAIVELALRMHCEPLRQYLALRLGSEEAARDALRAIADEVREWPVDAVTEQPGPRARLFALAREYLGEHADLSVSNASRVLPAEHGPRAVRALRKLSPDQAEVLELRHARELSPEEIAFVLSCSPRSVRRLLSKAEATANKALQLDAGQSLAMTAVRTFEVRPDPEGHAYMAQETRSFAVGTVIGDRYALEQTVGVGEFGQVYRASDKLVPGHVVALKLLHHPANSEEQREAALRELRLIASVSHPSIVSFKDHGWHEGRLWFVMPWYDGESLESRMLRAPLSRAEALGIFVPLANALATMHAVTLRHQDIKPDNIFLAELRSDPQGDPQVQPVLLDLGVAATDADSILAGTPQYFAPEVAATYLGLSDGSDISSKADVFSLALVLRNVLEPHSIENMHGTALEGYIARRARTMPPLPKGRDLKYLHPYLTRWLALRPDERPTAAEFARELQVLLEPEHLAEQRSAFLSWFVPLTALFLVVIAGGGFIWSQQMRQHERQTFQAHLAARNAKLAVQRETLLRRGLQETQEQLQDEVARTEQKSEALALALTETETEARVLSERAESLARAREETIAALEQTSEEVASLQTKTHELSTTKEMLEQQLSENQQRVHELMEQAKAGDELLTETRALLDREKNKREALSQALLNTRAELQTREDIAQDLQAQLDDTRRKLASAEVSSRSRGRELASLEVQLSGSQDELAKAQAALKTLRQELRAARSQLAESESSGATSEDVASALPKARADDASESSKARARANAKSAARARANVRARKKAQARRRARARAAAKRKARARRARSGSGRQKRSAVRRRH